MDNDMTEAQPSTHSLPSALDMIHALWRSKHTIILGTLACAVVAAAISLVLPKTFESRAILLAMPPPFHPAELPSKVQLVRVGEES